MVALPLPSVGPAFHHSNLSRLEKKNRKGKCIYKGMKYLFPSIHREQLRYKEIRGILHRHEVGLY